MSMMSTTTGLMDMVRSPRPPACSAESKGDVLALILVACGCFAVRLATSW
eukprot:COSAG06_NODE_55827_length_287_cov_1.936170_1_plen_49_part_01